MRQRAEFIIYDLEEKSEYPEIYIVYRDTAQKKKVSFF